MPDNHNPNPGFAAVLSFVFSGLGQIYNGQILKGLFLVALSTASLLSIIVGAVLIGYWLINRSLEKFILSFGSALFAIGLILVMIVGIYSILDAYKFAKKP